MSDNQQKNTSSGTFLQEEYLKSLDDFEVGQLIEGKVIVVNNEHVFIDVGYKSEGKINISEFDIPPSEGDLVSVVLLNKESRNGEIIVSKQKADEIIIWSKIKVAFQEGTAIEGKILRTVKGGFEIGLGGGNTGFNPFSKMDRFKINDSEKYVGTKSFFSIERLYSDKRVNIILSRRRWLEEERTKLREKFFQNASEGDIVEGTVKTFTSFGAFIDLGGFDGLLHVNDMHWKHVVSPTECVEKNQRLRFMIIRLDRETQQLNLSLKMLMPNPWENFTDKFQLHDTLAVNITKLTDFGAFAEIENGIEGLIHISEFSWTRRIKQPSEFLAVGDEVKVKILGFDLDARKISLGIKQTLPNPWDAIETNYPVSMKLRGVVKKVTVTGAFIELEEGIDGFLHSSDFSWTQHHRNLNSVLNIGDELDVIVLESNVEMHNIRLGVKQLEEDPWPKLLYTHSTGVIVQVEIINITNFGIFAKLDGGIEGFLPKVHLANARETNLDQELEKYSEGQKITVSILEIDIEKKKLTFSIREMNKNQNHQEMQKYIVKDTNDESSVTVADLLNRDDIVSHTDE